ncbi:paraquat-inducible protein a [Lasius niger]|uniref:Paraquat-inducible protein a n=1 Tax=Lasius niger TaxID=67767 RepID=A0A0J7JZ05_LASNI|nr:paraquat-inducible protein a [Lasius niger]
MGAACGSGCVTRWRRAEDLGLISCQICGQVVHAKGGGGEGCPRCGSALYRRRPGGYGRCWALLLSAVMMYIPANVVPVMRTTSPGSTEDNTILSGVRELFANGSWDLALLVFSASILVPAFKFVVLGLLLVSSQRGWVHLMRVRLRMYKVLEVIGYWSMLDVFVTGLLTAVVRFGVIGSVSPLPGVVFFALVVVLTMLASMSFDPRWIWDGVDDDDE